MQFVLKFRKLSNDKSHDLKRDRDINRLQGEADLLNSTQATHFYWVEQDTAGMHV